MKILIADDERISRVILRRFIKSNNEITAEITEAADGYEAVEESKEADIDIAILDIEMPVMDGLKAAREIKARNPNCQIVFLTAFADFKYAKEAISLGAAEYLVKPVSPEELWDMLEKCKKKLGLEKKQEKLFSDTDNPRHPEKTEESPNPSNGIQAGRAAMILAQVKEYMELHYIDDLSIESLAEQFGISINYLNRIFQGNLGMSGKEYLIHIRVEQAKEYLKDPSFTIREISLMTGYGDSNYFTRIFKKKTGMTPVEYRNRLLFGF